MSTTIEFARSFKLDNSFARDMAGFYAPWKPERAPAPKLLQLNRALVDELGLEHEELAAGPAAEIFSGNRLPDGASPLAQAYAGHQFGGFSPQLGDGRALLIGEMVDRHGCRRDIQLKGSGRTPFSRRGDGKAAVGPVLREYLIGEAMHALGVPTTRALAAVTTGERVQREVSLPGAVLTRVAASHIRVGTFQFFAARKETEKVRQLADYTIDRHYPELRAEDNPYLAMFEAICERQSALVASWMHVGFVHGVMNTDNMAISGETIDYGPCAFLDAYAPDAVFSSIDIEGRYAYGQQPFIAQWNLTRLAETLVALINPDKDEAARLLANVLNGFPDRYLQHWLKGMRAKIGLVTAEDGDLDLVNALLQAMAAQKADYTLVFRRLSQAVRGDNGPVRECFSDPTGIEPWMGRWRERLGCGAIKSDVMAVAMDRINPIYIPRNHKVEEALQTASLESDLQPFERMLAVLSHPFDEQQGLEDFAKPAPAWSDPYRTFCGT